MTAMSRRNVLAGLAVGAAAPMVRPTVAQAQEVPALPERPAGTWEAWDDFSTVGPVGAGSRMASGRAWSGAGIAGGSGFVVNEPGTIEKVDPIAAYLWTAEAAPPESAWIGFSFATGSTDGACAALCVSPKVGPDALGDNGVATNSVHLVYQPHQWQLGIYTNRRLRYLRIAPYLTRLADGEHGRGGMQRVAADTVAVYGPDGVVTVVADPEVATFWGRTVLCEVYQPPGSFSTDRRPRLHSFAVNGVWR